MSENHVTEGNSSIKLVLYKEPAPVTTKRKNEDQNKLISVRDKPIIPRYIYFIACTCMSPFLVPRVISI
jgi:hypothetical protein